MPFSVCLRRGMPDPTSLAKVVLVINTILLILGIIFCATDTDSSVFTNRGAGYMVAFSVVGLVAGGLALFAWKKESLSSGTKKALFMSALVFTAIVAVAWLFSAIRLLFTAGIFQNGAFNAVLDVIVIIIQIGTSFDHALLGYLCWVSFNAKPGEESENPFDRIKRAMGEKTTLVSGEQKEQKSKCSVM